MEKFASANLNDGYGSTCTATVCPVPSQLLLASNVAVNALNTFVFQFNYAGKLGTASHSSGGGIFNAYPVTGQKTTNPADYVNPPGTSNGLPFQVVAVQPGHTPTS